MGLGFQVVKYLWFQSFRCTYNLLRGIWWTISGTYFNLWRSRKPANYAWSAHILNIQTRHRLDYILEECGTHNFICTHGGFVHPEEVLKDHITLYTVGVSEAIFIETDKSIDVCSSEFGGFTKEPQFIHGKRMYVMPIASFHRLADHVGGPHKPIILLGNTARCGSTLVAQMFEKTGKILCFSEPDPFDSLALIVDKKMADPAEIDRLVLNGIRLLCKPLKTRDLMAYHVKITSTAMSVMPTMERLVPDLKHMFMYREGLAVGQSLVRSSHQMPLLRLLLILGKIHKSITSALIDQMGLPHSIFDIRVKNEVLMMAMVWAANCSKYLNYRKAGLPISAIMYEDILADATYAVEKIFEYCDIPQSYVKLGLTALESDSHKNSVLSRKHVRVRELKSLPAEYQADLDAVCDTLGVPRITGEPVVLDGTITHKYDK